MHRVIAYIDGFNFYFGLKSKHWRRYYWLDMQRLAKNLLQPDQQLAGTKYFTSLLRPNHDADKAKRQGIYLDTLQTLAGLRIVYGHYLTKRERCYKCQAEWVRPEEKMTDVNIAVELLADAFADNYDTALLMSGDSDLSAPIEKIRNLFPEKRVVVAFPPARESFHLKKLADAYFVIGRGVIAKSQLPDEVRTSAGFCLKRPPQWR